MPSKTRRIKDQIALLEQRLANAAEYLVQGVNVEGTYFLHFDDWNGKSGHPLWMKNVMMPATQRHRARKEKALLRISRENKNKRIKQRKRQRNDY